MLLLHARTGGRGGGHSVSAAPATGASACACVVVGCLSQGSSSPHAALRLSRLPSPAPHSSPQPPPAPLTKPKVDEGLRSLEQALALGFEDFAQVRSDKNLSKLRDSPKFADVINKYDEPVINMEVRRRISARDQRARGLGAGAGAPARLPCIRVEVLPRRPCTCGEGLRPAACGRLPPPALHLLT